MLSYSEIKSFSVYDGDLMLAYGSVGEAMQYGSNRVPKKKKQKKSEGFQLLLRLTDGETVDLVLFNSTVPRESREYDEERRTAEHFIAVMLEIKALAEAALSLTPPPPETESEQSDPALADVEAKLLLLKELCNKGLISQEQYTARSTEIISKI